MSFALVGTVGPAAAQVRRGNYLNFYGRVQWIAASKMVVVTGSTIVAIDLTRVPLSDYRGVRPGSAVFVEGVVSYEDGQYRVVATSITLIEEWQAP